ncbi:MULTISPECIES: hypothetical protein [Frankia]|nr:MULTISPECIES: hypothetical protein [Frankia]
MATSKDVPTLQAGAIVLGAVGMGIYVVADLVYAPLDPRVRVGRAR